MFEQNLSFFVVVYILCALWMVNALIKSTRKKENINFNHDFIQSFLKVILSNRTLQFAVLAIVLLINVLLVQK